MDFEFSVQLDYFAIGGFCPFCLENLSPDPSRFNKNVNKRGLVGEKSGLDLVGK